MKNEKEEIIEKRGRAAILDEYRELHPDIGEEIEIEDDDLWEHAHGRNRELAEKYNAVNGANSVLAERVSADPRSGLMLTEFASGKSLPYAMGKVYGREWIDGDLDEFEKGYQEHLAKMKESEGLMAEASANLEASMQAYSDYIKNNGLDEERSEKLLETIENTGHDILMGKFTPEFIDFIYKGLNYDQDIQAAAATGEIEGRNKAIELKKKKNHEAPMPDMGRATASATPKGDEIAERRIKSWEDAIKPLS